MIELPEAYVYAEQLRQTVTGDQVVHCEAAAHPHKLAFYSGDPHEYPDMLQGGTVLDCVPWGGLVELQLTGVNVLVGDGARLRLYEHDEEFPAKHQLKLVLASGRALQVSIQMYGGIWVYAPNTNDNPYYIVAQEKPTPFSDAFNTDYWERLWQAQKPNLSMKALLATEQRIPGLGNGVLQDILWRAGLHPKKKLSRITSAERQKLFGAIKQTLSLMRDQGGRSTEQDLFGRPGGYPVQLCAKTLAQPCPACSTPITAFAYMGGRVYVCPHCQPE